MTAVAEPADLDTKLERFFLALGKVRKRTHEHIVAGDLLLEEVLQNGTAAHARSLILWRFTTGKDPQVLYPHRLCKTLCSHIYSQIGASRGLDDILEIMDEVIGTGRMSRMPEDLQLEIRLAIVESDLIRLGDAQKWELFETYLHPMWKDSDPASSLAQLEIVVKKWLREYRFAHVMRLLDAWEAYSHSMPMHLLSAVFTASMSHRRLVYCSTILLRDRSVDEITTDLIKSYELFILACGRKSMTRLLVTHFNKLKDDQTFIAALLPQLSANARTILSEADADVDALVADVAVVLDNVFAAGLSSDIIGKRVARRIKHKWRTTHDLDVVVDLFKQAMKRADDRGFNRESILPIELALIEVISDAGRVDEALKILSNLSESGVEVTNVLCAGLVVLAKKGAWKQFDGMMTVLASRKDLVEDAYNLRNIERALYLYSLPHSADETWQFGARLTGQLRIPISQRMTTIVLQSFVYNERLDLIRKWLDHANSLVGEADLNEKTVGKLVETFYLKHRPPHALFLSMCHTFLHQTGYRDHQPFIETAMECIGYDLRHNTANPSHMPVVLQLSAENLKLMMSANGTFPRPLQIHHIEQQRERLKAVKSMALHMPEGEGAALIAEPEVEAGPDDELAGVEANLQQSTKSKRHMRKRDRALLAANKETSLEPVGTLSDLEASSGKPTSKGRMPSRGPGKLTSDQNAPDSDDKLSGVQYALDLECSDGDILKGPIGFNDLREEPSEHERSNQSKAESRTGPWVVQDDLPVRPRRLEREMIFALSRRDYHQVLELYRSSLGSGGMPASYRALEVAVEAALQETPGLLEGAKKLLAEATACGMNTAAARGPLLMMEMNNFTPEVKKNAPILRNKVLDFYRANESCGLKIGRTVGVHAANILINNHCAQDGLRILRSLHVTGDLLYRPDDSEHAATDPTFNIVVLTVFIKAFVSLGQANGIRWAVAYILQHNIRVDIALLNSLRHHVKVLSAQHRVDRNALPPRTRLALAKYLRDARLLLSARRSQQLLESARFGKKLLRCLRRWRFAMLERDSSRTFLFAPGAEGNRGRARNRRPFAAPRTRDRRLRKEMPQPTSQLPPIMASGHEHDDGDLQHDALSHLMRAVAASG
jgi:hypothetical protein